ncbi:probable LRR receptor-like serine/threonine-protein kinase At3g47570 isoform X2 [Nymphaea colorata]|uniref:probable LRR receptor-like serine/threonine-protein kinase At3g47570 isoform X2 n=1 Tax=Nymphaea colorata TaxID=210225 RepID=UPI00214F46AE|nr:probable LRR receptor-like serine/threonine-protein kinase At3g47570 isoform X2 [Nymphaea colorata]
MTLPAPFHLLWPAFQSSRLAGTVPPGLFNISSLRELNLQFNYLTGNLPQDVGLMLPNLERIALDNNTFSGSIPQSLAICKNLQELSLGMNQFSGDIPSWLCNMPDLMIITLSINNFVGSVPPCLANLSKLEVLELSRNNLHGNIPDELGSLLHLRWLNFAINNLTGKVPNSIFNISTLQTLSLSRNNLTGQLPPNFGFSLPNLEKLLMSECGLHGQIPTSLANATKLEIVVLANNMLSGWIPSELGRLMHLKTLFLEGNILTNMPNASELSVITALTNCRLLEKVAISENFLNGVLPASLGNFSSNLQVIDMAINQIGGAIPSEVTNLTYLNRLDLGSNRISGMIPSGIGKLQNLQGLYIGRNMLEGPIPPQLYQIIGLVELDLSDNMLSGSISSSIANLSNLRRLAFYSNHLSSVIPLTFWELKDLEVVILGENSLTGSLPLEIGNLAVAYAMDLSRNKLSGDLPASLSKLQMLQYLNLSKNSFSGHIPQKLDAMVDLESLDLSYNSLSGGIPETLGLLRSIKSLNLSFNQLRGEIPSNGIFANLTADSFAGNYGLCGAPRFEVPTCPKESKQHKKSNLTTIVIASTLGSFEFLFIVVLLIKFIRARVVVPKHESVESLVRSKHPFISYRVLVRATNNFDNSNLIGKGSFGSVYKGILSDGTAVAVKVLNLFFEGALNSFNIECDVMSKVRHRNLLKVISSCTNEEFKALVLQYMPRGSLENCLYASSESLNLLQRLDIMINVACAMEYLHHDLYEPVIHCDLKPSNVLLDDDMTAYVADLGIAKMLLGCKSSTLTETLGTTGYIAPEFGLAGRVTTKVDVYSFGVLLLEIFTRRKPTDVMFTGDASLRQWVAEALPHAILEVVDGCLLNQIGSSSSNNGQQEPAGSTTRDELLVSIMQVGLSCSRESPTERIDMREVVAQLKKIRAALCVLEMAN